jgi:D-alanyl-D-alanine dipeptidase
MKNLSSFKISLVIISLVGGLNCKNNPPEKSTSPVDSMEKTFLKDETSTTIETDKSAVKPVEVKNKINTQLWTELSGKDGFVVDIRYATTDNFTKKKIYDCGKCFLRPEAAKALKNIRSELYEKYGYSIKVFDCFRPKAFQQRLWDIVPNPDYVTPPQKGSMHSRGLAVDLTIVDKEGMELNMGTTYDFFGEEAHQDYKGHSDKINKNRSLLKATMEKYGFGSIRTEWWHYSYTSKSYPLDEWIWDCQ